MLVLLRPRGTRSDRGAGRSVRHGRPMAPRAAGNVHRPGSAACLDTAEFPLGLPRRAEGVRLRAMRANLVS